VLVEEAGDVEGVVERVARQPSGDEGGGVCCPSSPLDDSVAATDDLEDAGYGRQPRAAGRGPERGRVAGD